MCAVTKHEGRITYSTRVHLISSTLDACVVVVERNMMHYNALQVRHRKFQKYPGIQGRLKVIVILACWQLDEPQNDANIARMSPLVTTLPVCIQKS